MSDIVDLDEHRPHISGPVVCTRCRHKWTAVRPVGAELLECPTCGASCGASLDTMLHKPHIVLGEECCGQRDGDGVCASPACLYGDALMLVQCIRDAAHLECTALRAEVERLRAGLEKVMIGGNHLATIIGATHPQGGTHHEAALAFYGPGPQYDAWCCWNAIMEARSLLTQGENSND